MALEKDIYPVLLVHIYTMNRIPIGLIHACSRREFQEISRLVVGSGNLVNMQHKS